MKSFSFVSVHIAFSFRELAWRNPVLSGPTDLPGETDASPDNQTTCEENPSSPDQTSAAPEPPAVPQQDQTPQSDIHPLAPRQSYPIALLKDDAIPLTIALRETVVDPNTQYLIDERKRGLQQQATLAIPPAERPAAV